MNLKVLLAVWASFVLGACAQTETKKAVDNEVSAEPVRAMHGDVAMKGFEAIQSSTSLTTEQKTKLKDLHAQMAEETFKNQSETSKLKGVLFETITTSPYDGKKVEEIKGRLLKLNDQKMKSMLEAVGKVQKIVGTNNTDEYKELYRHLLIDNPAQSQKF